MATAAMPACRWPRWLRDMRNRFLVAVVFAIPIAVWSMLGRDVFGRDLPTPFGMDVDVWQFLLSLPVVFYSSSIFFAGAVAALRRRTLDMMVLVAVAIGSGGSTPSPRRSSSRARCSTRPRGLLATFVLLGHWFEMRARGGANDAIRALLDLAPPKAVVVRDGEPVEVPTAEVAVGDLLLIRPAPRCRSTPTVDEGESRSTSRW